MKQEISRVYNLSVGQTQDLSIILRREFPTLQIGWRVSKKPGYVIFTFNTTDPHTLVNIGERIGKFIANQSLTF